MSSSRINQNWVFGGGACISVTATGAAAVSGGFPLNTFEGCASVSDGNGQLLFYTDGVQIWDSAGTVKVSGLHGESSSTQSALIVPDPGDQQQWYVFTTAGYSSGLNFHHFDGVRIRISGGTWTVTQLSSLMSMPPTTGLSPTEKLTAVWHRDCVDVWVITMLNISVNQNADTGPGVLRVFRISPSGVVHAGDTPLGVTIHDQGYLRVNRSGSRLAFANLMLHNLFVYCFNNFSGAINVPSALQIPVPPIPLATTPPSDHERLTYGVEFSPKGDILYYSVVGTGNTGTLPSNNGYIFQVDLATSPASVLIQTYPNVGTGYAIGALQLGNDGRIYVAKDSENSIGAIENADLVWPGCTVTMNFLPLASGQSCRLGLPNLVTSLCDCVCHFPGCFGTARQLLDRARRRLRI